MNIGALVFLLCAVSSVGCAVLLLRSYRRSPTSILLWTTLAFIALAANNVFLFIDLVVTGPTVDLSWIRLSSALVAGAVLIYGLVWEVES